MFPDRPLSPAEANGPAAFALRARYVFPVSGPPIADGLITIAGGKLVAVGENSSGRPPLDLGNVAILPGLVNAHTHLEFSDLAAPLGKPGMPFADWIRTVVAWRRTVAGQPRHSIGQGVRESLAAGSTMLGEIRTEPAWPENAEPPLWLGEFAEVICLAEERFPAALDRVRSLLLRPARKLRPRSGISPHAPYTVHPELFARLMDLAVETSVPVACHLAESTDELELLATGRGPLRELLEELGVWNVAAFSMPRRSLDYLSLLSRAPRALVIHGNYLASDEIEFLAAHRDRLSVVYCPRTHAYFGHTRHPLPRLVEAGVSVALGTDSRASNPDLNLLAEMRYVAANYPELPPPKVLELSTLSGAQALGCHQSSGSLAAGKQADLTVIKLPETAESDPHALVLRSDQPVVATMVHGRWVWQAVSPE